MRGRKAGPVGPRFLAKVDTSGECWVWVGYRNRQGYGHFGRAGRVERAHRVAYELFCGPVPQGMDVLHRCDNPSCVRPDHLFLGTDQDNVNDKRAKGRQARMRGTLSGTAKLTEQIVIQIRASYPLRTVSKTEFAARYGIHRRTLSDIINRRTWRHI